LAVQARAVRLVVPKQLLGVEPAEPGVIAADIDLERIRAPAPDDRR
jgi:hypothetical protein